MSDTPVTKAPPKPRHKRLVTKLDHRRENELKQSRRLKRGRMAAIRKHQRETGIGFLAEQVSLLPGGFPNFLPYLRAAARGDTRFTAAIEAFDNLDWYNRNQRSPFAFEEVCLNTGVPIGEFVGVAVGIAYDYRRNLARFIAAQAMPEVMKVNAEEATKPDGIEDRRMFMQSTGLLPVPKGSTVNVAAVANASSTTVGGEPSGLRPFEERTISLSEAIRQAVDKAPRELPSEPIDLPIEADEVG